MQRTCMAAKGIRWRHQCQRIETSQRKKLENCVLFFLRLLFCWWLSTQKKESNVLTFIESLERNAELSAKAIMTTRSARFARNHITIEEQKKKKESKKIFILAFPITLRNWSSIDVFVSDILSSVNTASLIERRIGNKRRCLANAVFPKNIDCRFQCQVSIQ